MSSTAHPRPRTLWDEGRRSGRDVVSLAVALLLTATVLDLLLSDGLGLLYDLVFATLCVGAALAVRPSDFFAVGVLPPLAMFAIVLLLALSDPGSVARADDGVVQATVSGLSRHAVALVLGYGACLGLLAARRSYLQRHPATD
ncbi:DUF6542 domain-containing protein [Pimelobacter simplex]|uniref:DUF6542 domain-containing protein n=1 Tax=Nocardioides simplex TaxID=2045 RepID=UPI0021501886|nr:DUF6542 domain-containing protein [Pimelobacter simplex]UUW89778.1 hypothetical protein M0M43_29225 [Pimelobacter simplex]UUW93607.1 hypothetical protein M0M48_17880 [Pimelobacter simplex]